ncbi:MAG: LysR substrate-binding domain-containing protein, partial [Solirubrobacteraceae bacterium]
GFIPAEAHVAAETSTLIAFVAAGMGVSLVPASATQMRVIGAIYRPLVEVATVELALAWRRDVELPIVRRAVNIVREAVSKTTLMEIPAAQAD